MLPTFKNPTLLTRALTHRSYLNEHPEVEPEDNERLEFLGDAVLDFVVANWLFRQHPDFDEGRLTSIRSALVRAEKLERTGEPDRAWRSLAFRQRRVEQRRTSAPDSAGRRV